MPAMESDQRRWNFHMFFLVIFAVLLASTVRFAFRLRTVRRRIHEYGRRGLAMPPHSMLFGHLQVMGEIASKHPSGATTQYIPTELKSMQHNVGSTFYLDIWPFSTPLLVLASPNSLRQATQEHSLPKFPNMQKFTTPIAGKKNLLTMEGQVWKTWRSLFNPIFNPSHIMEHLPQMVEDVETFKSRLNLRAQQGGLFQLKTLTDDLVMDINGRLVLSVSLNCQQTTNPLISALRKQIPWMTFGGELNLWQRWHPLRPFVTRYNTHRMNQYLDGIFEDQVRLSRKQTSHEKAKSSKTLLGTLVDTYCNEVEEQGGDSAAFKSQGLQQMKLFLFAGQDSTSTSVCYTFYVLSKHPEILARLTAEHDQVLTADATKGASLITGDPHLINHLPYTMAVVKETLRLYPPLSSAREGEPGFSVIGDDGREYPTEGCMVWACPRAVHTDPSFWPEPDSFIPERWLVAPGDPLYPVKGAWRPFEHGPRGCIGQEFAMTTMRLTLALTCREYSVSPAFEEWDQMRGTRGTRRPLGERAFQHWNGVPDAGIPCRVQLQVH